MSSTLRSLATFWWRWERPALTRAITPIWLVSALVAAVLFGRNGLAPRDVTDPVATTLSARFAWLIVWGLFTTPGLLTHANASCREMLVSQPISSLRITTVLWISSSAVHLPLALLLVAGGGVGLCITLVSAVIAVQSHMWMSFQVGTARRESIAVACLIVALSLIPLPAHVHGSLDALVIALSATLFTALALWGLHRVWRSESVSNRSVRAQTFSHVAVLALAKNHALALYRMHRIAVLRSLLLTLCGGALTALLLRNRNEITLHASWPVLSVMESMVFVMSASVLGFPLLEQERQQSALFDSLHVRAMERLSASAWVLLLGNLAAAITFWFGQILLASRMHTITREMGWTLLHQSGIALGVAMLVDWWIRRSRDRNNAILGLVGMAILGSITGGQLGVWWSPLVALLGVFALGARAPLQETA